MVLFTRIRKNAYPVLGFQVAPNMSLQVIGAAANGTKVVLWSESRMPRQTWRIDSFGRICSQMFEDKVLDVKGNRMGWWWWWW